MDFQAIIWTEGKTDWQHLQRAFSALRVSQQVTLHESDVDFGDDQLLKQCIALAKVNQSVPTIFLFDRDNEQILRKVVEPGRDFKAWGNNVYSFPIPVPPHRTGEPGACIELYYTDDELRTKDDCGRRLFLSTEFNPTSGRSYVNPTLSIGNKNRLPPSGAPKRIIDCEVFDETSTNVALSKAEFARNVNDQRGPFGNLKHDSFHAILAVINEIIADATQGNDLVFGDFELFLRSLDGLDAHHQLTSILERAIRVCKLATMIFVAATLRCYEQQIIEPSGNDIRKVRPLKQLLADSFGAASLTTLQKLARNCFHLIDDRAPSVLVLLKSMMAEAPTLGAVGDMLEQLERVLPSGRSHVRTLNMHDAKKPILEYIIPEFAKYEARVQEITETASAAGSLRAGADPTVWREALSTLVRVFERLSALTMRVRTLERVRSDTDEFLGRTVTYRPKSVTSEDLTVKHGDLEDDRLESYELLSEEGENQVTLDLFPFLTVRSGRICFYSKTRSQGYEYHPAFGPTGHIWPTKRKFSHVAFRSSGSSDLQGLFWAQATPSTSSTGVKANIPARESIVGRKQQINEVLNDIIQIPNQNGIIYGPGGVGKTALLIELSRRLFEAPQEGVQFKNIIWISAKRDSHDPTLGVTETRVPQYQSMDNVLDAIMEFQGFEDANGYDRQDKKMLVLESFQEERTLLILDNLETVPRTAQGEIIRFFGLEVKRALRDKPDYFKVLITSRELIPSGFHQMELRGLDKRESKELMQRLYEPYSRSGRAELSTEQMDAIYDATRGIPLIIKHCYGQVYEFNRSVDAVLKGLSQAGNRVVDFSFAEMLQLLKQDEVELKTLLVLELAGRSLMARQIADILGLSEAVIEDRLTPLVSYQCVIRSSTGLQEKYSISDDIRFFTRRLTIEYANVATEVKRKIIALPIEKRMDYSQEEADTMALFQEYLSRGNSVSAGEFMCAQLKIFPDSVLLNLHYAKYLKEFTYRAEEAIERLEHVRERSGNDPQILQLLMAYYAGLQFPNFERAHAFAQELEASAGQDSWAEFELAKFYVSWSTALLMQFCSDPIKDIVRRQRYKELADIAIRFLDDIYGRSHEWYYLMAQALYNRWEYDRALRQIEMAILELPPRSHLASGYLYFKSEIVKKRARFATA